MPKSENCDYDLQELREVATNLYGSDEIEIDSLTCEDLSEADEHVWVRAWVYINHDELTIKPEGGE